MSETATGAGRINSAVIQVREIGGKIWIALITLVQAVPALK